MILSKTVEASDYLLIEEQVIELEKTFNYLSNRGVKLDAWNVSHTHRKWEWGMAIKALELWKEMYYASTFKFLDVGSGDGMLGPTISFVHNVGIHEIEPRMECYHNRVMCNSLLVKQKAPEIKWLHGGVESSILNGQEFDVVFCISVIEHVAADHDFLRRLADLTAHGGLLFLTTDVVPKMPGRYHFDNLREHNFTMFDICKIIEYLKSVGFENFGEVDLEYKGDEVYNYSFCSLAMVKK